MTIILGYWDIRGLAHAIRLLLEYTDSNYEEKQYTMGDAPDYDRSQWLNEKSKLGLDFPNLPYLIDGTHKLTQSNAILRHIGRKHNMCGETEKEKIRVDLMENQVMDVRLHMARICYSPDFMGGGTQRRLMKTSGWIAAWALTQEKLKPGYLKEIPGRMKLFSVFLGKRCWFAGNKLTYVDFLAYDILDLQRIFEPRCLDEFPNLKDFLTRFEVIPVIPPSIYVLLPPFPDAFLGIRMGLKKISAYMKSSRFLPSPLFLKLAVWGNK